MARIAEALPCVVAATIPNADPADISTSGENIANLSRKNSRSSNLSIQRSLIYRQVGGTEWLVKFKIVPMSILPAQKNEGYLNGYLRSRWL